MDFFEKKGYVNIYAQRCEILKKNIKKCDVPGTG